MQFELLDKHHDRQAFDCGNEALNRYLSQYANQHAKGQGLAHYLIANAFNLTNKLANEIGIAVIRVDLKHLGLVSFYEQYGFKQTEKDSLTMYLMIKDIP